MNFVEKIRMGNLEVRLAQDEAEIKAAQELRYRVFYEEMQAQASPEIKTAGRDFDDFDSRCDHLLVIDHHNGRVVGNYRLLRQKQGGGSFYSNSEYDLTPLLNYPGKILELGRSCVDAQYRTRQVMQLLWRGIAAYIFHYEVEIMFGCASLPGVTLSDHAHALSYLYHYHLAPPALRPIAVTERYVDMRLFPKEDIVPKQALAKLPPLIKGYLRLSGFVGDGAVVDHQFQTVDISIVVKTDLITEKYYKHYQLKT